MLTKVQLYGILALSIVLAIFGFYVFHQINKPIIKTDVKAIEIIQKEKQIAVDKAKEYEEKAKELNSKLTQKEAKNAQDAAEVAGLKARLKGLENASPEASNEPSGPADASSVAAQEISILKEIVDKQDVEIKGLQETNSILKQQNFDLLASNEQFKIALDKSDKQLVLYKIGADAQAQALKSAKWQGRTQGFGAGVLATLGAILATR